MALATDTSKHRSAGDIVVPARSPPGTVRRQAKRRRRGRIGFPLTARILAINILALAVLVAGFLYLDRYQSDLMEAKIRSLVREADLVAAALGETVVGGAEMVDARLDARSASVLIHRLGMPSDTRILLFDARGALLVDSQRLPVAPVRTTELPPPDQGGFLKRIAISVYDWLIQHLPPHTTVPLHREVAEPAARDYPEAVGALDGARGGAVRRAADGRLVAMVAVPVQPLRLVRGALVLSADAEDVSRSVREVRFTILQAFGIAIGITVLLSLYFAGTIARPVRRLARAAERVRAGGGRKVVIPDLTARHDEIGRLSAALRDMTEALWIRMDAIERFVADVAHEVKNPLSSVRSAVETARRIDDVKKRQQLLEIVGADVMRLDRLLSEITDASKVDTELSRLEPEPVDLAAMARTIAEVHDAAAANDSDVSIRIEIAEDGPHIVLGSEDRLAQVLQNLISNARSFAPPGGSVILRLQRTGDTIALDVDDDGPGVPLGMEEAIFRRFYTLRPQAESFGAHSGLGLSISRQIVEGHGGRLTCQNRVDPKGIVRGARFSVRIPVARRRASDR